MLDLQSEEQNRKKKKEYDTWNEEVHMKIMNSILDSVKKRVSWTVERNLREKRRCPI